MGSRQTIEPIKFRKKPVVIEAIQWDGSEAVQAAIVKWAKGAVAGWFDDSYHLLVDTEEGSMRADPGDWIIRGVEGEFYPCKPSIFAKTYDRGPDA